MKRFDSFRFFSRVLLFIAAVLLSGCQKQEMLSSSMSPTIKPGEKVTVDYLAYARATPSRWDVIVFHPPSYPDDYWAMRVVGLPGENIVIRHDGLLIDGKAVSPPVHVQAIHYVPLATTNTTVPTNSYFVLGDNSTNANDSRYIGTIPVANILGKVKEK